MGERQQMTFAFLKKASFLLALSAMTAWQPVVAQEQARKETASEQEAAPANIHRVWAVTPKLEAVDEFMAAVKAHLQWRLDNQDPWQWQLYVARSGEVDGTVFLRSDGRTRADLDAYPDLEFSKKADKHWKETVHPLVASYSTQMSRSDLELSHWPEEEFKIYLVTRFHLKPGHGAAFRAVVVGINAKMKEAGRIHPHGWNWAMTGEHLPTSSLVLGRKDWKGFDTPEESALDVLTDSLGPAQAVAMIDALYSHVERISQDFYFRIHDFSAE
jgi:hypothetical protein